MLADDDQDDCLLFEEAFTELDTGFQLKTVSDGDALVMFLHSADAFPAIVFLDLNMPRKNGRESLAIIKGSATLKELCIVIISTSFHPVEVEDLYELGAQLYVHKPNSFEGLKSGISRAIDRSVQYNRKQPPRSDFVITPDLVYEERR